MEWNIKSKKLWYTWKITGGCNSLVSKELERIMEHIEKMMRENRGLKLKVHFFQT